MEFEITTEDKELGKVSLTLEDGLGNSNVVIFPKAKKGTPPLSNEEFRRKTEEDKQEVAITIAQELTLNIVESLGLLGFDFYKDEKSAVDLVMIIEQIRALILRMHGMDHSLHAANEYNVKIDNPKEFLNNILGVYEDDI